MKTNSDFRVLCKGKWMANDSAMKCNKYFPNLNWCTTVMKNAPESPETAAQPSNMLIAVARFLWSVVQSSNIIMEEADSSATTVHRSTQMMKAAVFSKTTVHSSTLTMQAADSSVRTVHISKAIQRYITKGSNINTILALFCVGFTKCYGHKMRWECLRKGCWEEEETGGKCVAINFVICSSQQRLFGKLSKEI